MNIRIERGDFLVVSGAPRCISNIVLLLKAKFIGAKVIWWGHYWSSTSKHWRFALRLLIMRLSDALLFYTDQEVEEYRRHVGNNGATIVYALNNGLNTTSVQLFRDEYVAYTRPLSILFIGRLTEKANLALLVNALSTVALSQAFLHVIGDGEEYEGIFQLVNTLGISNRVLFHGAMTNECSISAVANQCRVFAYPGEVGLSLIHGMAYGLPAVVHSNRWKHMPEISAFNSGVTGQVFKQDDVNSLSSVLADLLSDVNLLDSQSRECLKIISSTFNTADMAERFMHLMRALKSN